MHLRELHNQNQDGKALILGNGPSLSHIGTDLAVTEGPVIGVNRMWDSPLVPDYWVWQDDTIAIEAAKLPREWREYVTMVTWQHPKPYMQGICAALEHPPERTIMVNKSYMAQRYPCPQPGMETEEFVEHGTWPGMPRSEPVCVERCEGNSLWKGMTTTAAAIHLALIMGCSEIHLYGCEGVPRGDRVHFTGDVAVSEKKLGQLERARWILDQMYGLWKDRVRMVNHSEGYEGPWPKE